MLGWCTVCYGGVVCGRAVYCVLVWYGGVLCVRVVYCVGRAVQCVLGWCTVW